VKKPDLTEPTPPPHVQSVATCPQVAELVPRTRLARTLAVEIRVMEGVGISDNPCVLGQHDGYCKPTLKKVFASARVLAKPKSCPPCAKVCPWVRGTMSLTLVTKSRHRSGKVRRNARPLPSLQHLTLYEKQEVHSRVYCTLHAPPQIMVHSRGEPSQLYETFAEFLGEAGRDDTYDEMGILYYSMTASEVAAERGGDSPEKLQALALLRGVTTLHITVSGWLQWTWRSQRWQAAAQMLRRCQLPAPSCSLLHMQLFHLQQL